MEKKLEISQPLAQAIHDYLVSRPMGEVEAMVSGLRALSPMQQTGYRAQRNDDGTFSIADNGGWLDGHFVNVAPKQ